MVDIDDFGCCFVTRFTQVKATRGASFAEGRLDESTGQNLLSD